MVILIYSIIIFIACTIGALVGIGGGVIIKPMLDMIGFHTVDVVGFISTCAVFAMSISSSVKHITSKTEMNKKIVLFVSFGSIFGGIIGNEIFDAVFEKFNTDIVKGVQAVIIAAFIIFVIIYVNSKNVKTLKITNPIAIVLTGLMLGLMSAFLGIGGGPINTAFLVLLFSFNVKESAVYSVAIIFFSQLSQLITIFINNRFEPYKEYFPIVVCAMVVAVVSGLIGSKLNKKLSNDVITKVFSIVLSFVAVVNVYNAIRGFTA
ncbi:MAG: sulfite exporter TauE/SafE family protein [Eubacteriales bacterium]|nr:sulfite exporter TauE/SafE family protein [Eubacteriales bacterium]